MSNGCEQCGRRFRRHDFRCDEIGRAILVHRCRADDITAFRTRQAREAATAITIHETKFCRRCERPSLKGTERAARLTFVNDYQWQMYKDHRVWARELWIIQGDNGGHATDYDPTEREIRRIHGPFEPASPVQLRCRLCIPIYNRARDRRRIAAARRAS